MPNFIYTRKKIDPMPYLLILLTSRPSYEKKIKREADLLTGSDRIAGMAGGFTSSLPPLRVVELELHSISPPLGDSTPTSTLVYLSTNTHTHNQTCTLTLYVNLKS